MMLFKIAVKMLGFLTSQDSGRRVSNGSWTLGSPQNLEPTDLPEVVIEGGDSFHPQSAHRDERNRVAERIRLVRMLPQQLDGRTVVDLGHLHEVEQRVFQEIDAMESQNRQSEPLGEELSLG